MSRRRSGWTVINTSEDLNIPEGFYWIQQFRGREPQPARYAAKTWWLIGMVGPWRVIPYSYAPIGPAPTPPQEEAPNG